MSENRVLPLAGVHNFRDYGGYGVAGGGRLRKGVLFRSGQHLEATPDDLAAVDALGIANIIDLRGDNERLLYPCRRGPGFAAAVLFAPGETTGAGSAPHVEAAASQVEAPAASLASGAAAEARLRMTNSYAVMPFRPVLAGSFSHYFAALGRGEGASLVHCLAGKDRTGLAVALLQALMGVHADDIMADYLLTNTAGDVERRIEAGGRLVRAHASVPLDDDAVRVVMSVEPAYLDTAFAAIRERHGSVEAYAEAACGVTPALREAIAAQLIEG
ncbi:tyrosine-protein phosphatase [Polymorphobacter arshaanensis]|uniref:Tyrosine-protein phosphatase n=1 Tax=Glacieibacterium arshaanense TaxID=2511025 RepID=A0A4Y9EMR1_9SPHN|nr:tyrosine-protein phosphatase [Polymorphobacter arshaanensis]TFU01465.1 tyrosine-protein phosphatase [Polymorphobacter arshaanensis]